VAFSENEYCAYGLAKKCPINEQKKAKSTCF